MVEPLKHGDRIFSAQFRADGRRVLTASADRTARLWDAQGGQPLTEPLKHKTAVFFAQFSPDGQQVLTLSADQRARVWKMPTAPVPVPEWVLDLAEAIAAKRFNDERISEPVPFSHLQTLKSQLAGRLPTNAWDTLPKWFFADAAARTVSPFSVLTLTEFVQRRIDENTLDSLWEAVKVVPTNALALARLARSILAQDPMQNPRRLGQADWHSRRAVEFGPDQAEAWRIRAEVLRQLSALPEAQEALRRAQKLAPDSPKGLAMPELIENTDSSQRPPP